MSGLLDAQRQAAVMICEQCPSLPSKRMQAGAKSQSGCPPAGSTSACLIAARAMLLARSWRSRRSGEPAAAPSALTPSKYSCTAAANRRALNAALPASLCRVPAARAALLPPAPGVPWAQAPGPWRGCSSLPCMLRCIALSRDSPRSGPDSQSLYRGTRKEAVHSEGRPSSDDCQLQAEVGQELADTVDVCRPGSSGHVWKHASNLWWHGRMASFPATHTSHAALPASATPGHAQRCGVVVQQRTQQADLLGGAVQGVGLAHAAQLADHGGKPAGRSRRKHAGWLVTGMRSGRVGRQGPVAACLARPPNLRRLHANSLCRPMAQDCPATAAHLATGAAREAMDGNMRSARS